MPNKIITVAFAMLFLMSYYPYYRSVGIFVSIPIWISIKGLILFPSIVADGINCRYVSLAFLAIDATVIYSVFSPPTLANLLMGGSCLVAPILLKRAMRLGVIRVSYSSENRTNTPSNQKPVGHPQSFTPSVLDPSNQRFVGHPRSDSDRQFVSQLIPKVASLFIAGLSGSGKDFVGSILCEYLQSEFGARIFFIDPKNDPSEHLWDNADYQYRFSGTMMEPDEFLNNLKKAFRHYQEKLTENGSSQYTILVLNELATTATKCDNSSDKKWLSATLQPMLSGLDSVGGAVMVLTQTLIMPTGFNSGTVSQFQKLIICREEHIENLSTQSKAVLMNGVDHSGARGACEDSPVGRAIYSSSLRRWLSLPKLRQGQSYYDRDSRSWVGTPPDRNKNSENGGDLGVNTRTHAVSGDSVSTLMLDVLAYFENTNTEAPRTVRDIRMGSRIRKSGASVEEVEDVLSQLCQQGQLIRTLDGWQSPKWIREGDYNRDTLSGFDYSRN